MEEVNEMVSTSQIADNLPRINFDYSRFDEETIDVMQDAENIMQVTGSNTKFIWGQQLNRVREQLANKSYQETNFREWFTALNLKKGFVYDTISYYNARVHAVDTQKILTLSDSKISAIGKLTEEQQKEVLGKAPLENMSVNEVRKLVTEVKETGEYSEELLNEIRQKDDKIKTKEAETKQLQQEKEQKDQEIAELRSKLKELEETKVQPVAQPEPQVVEKIVEVEKVVEKEVVPKEIEEELKALKIENDALIKDNKDKASFIEGQNSTIIEQRQKIDNLKIDDSIPEDTIPAMKLGSLLSFIDCFLRDTSGFTLLKGQFSEISDKSKQTLLNSIDRVEDWCLLMKQAISNDKNMLGNNIIIESEND